MNLHFSASLLELSAKVPLNEFLLLLETNISNGTPDYWINTGKFTTSVFGLNSLIGQCFETIYQYRHQLLQEHSLAAVVPDSVKLVNCFS